MDGAHSTVVTEVAGGPAEGSTGIIPHDREQACPASTAMERWCTMHILCSEGKLTGSPATSRRWFCLPSTSAHQRGLEPHPVKSVRVRRSFGNRLPRTIESRTSWCSLPRTVTSSQVLALAPIAMSI